MAKQSAAEKLTARIDADIARVQAVKDYIGSGDGLNDVETRIADDLSRLVKMRDYVTSDGEASATEKPKRTRGAGKRGLPKTAPAQSNGE